MHDRVGTKHQNIIILTPIVDRVATKKAQEKLFL